MCYHHSSLLNSVSCGFTSKNRTTPIWQDTGFWAPPGIKPGPPTGDEAHWDIFQAMETHFINLLFLQGNYLFIIGVSWRTERRRGMWRSRRKRERHTHTNLSLCGDLLSDTHAMLSHQLTCLHLLFGMRCGVMTVTAWGLLCVLGVTGSVHAKHVHL